MNTEKPLVLFTQLNHLIQKEEATQVSLCKLTVYQEFPTFILSKHLFSNKHTFKSQAQRSYIPCTLANKKNDIVSAQEVIYELEDFIVEDCSPETPSCLDVKKNQVQLIVKPQLSSIEGVTRKATGRKMDSIYVGAEMELGALEIGSRKNDDTKDLKDGYSKLPIVMKDMLKIIVDKYPTIKEKVNIVGYNIQDNNISFMSMDTPKGYVTRIRRLKELSYPTSSEDYTARMPALLTITYNGFKTVNDTLSAIQSCKSQLLPVIHSDGTFVLPLTLAPSKPTASKASESNSSL